MVSCSCPIGQAIAMKNHLAAVENRVWVGDPLGKPCHPLFMSLLDVYRWALCQFHVTFLSLPLLMHDGPICIAFRMSGFTAPTLCTTTTEQSYLVDWQAALCTNKAYCAFKGHFCPPPPTKLRKGDIVLPFVRPFALNKTYKVLVGIEWYHTQGCHMMAFSQIDLLWPSLLQAENRRLPVI